MKSFLLTISSFKNKESLNQQINITHEKSKQMRCFESTFCTLLHDKDHGSRCTLLNNILLKIKMLPTNYYYAWHNLIINFFFNGIDY